MSAELQLDAETLLDRILAEYPGRVCITCSFQAEDMVVLHMLRSRVPDIPVLFLDTGYHFQETYAYRDRMATAWKLNLVNLLPSLTTIEQENTFGILYRSDPGRCCHLRKVEPLMAALERFDLWFTGLRREQSPTRKNLQPVEQHQLPSGRSLVKVSLLADWNWGHVSEAMAHNQIEYLPLYSQGYPSIGCEPCTALPTNVNEPRSGRWAGLKLECGIHTFSQRAD
ncbi:MAG TPA: phosphoadenylyl-sulfate reductase [Candidatus Angelobacter sp.]